MTISRLFWDFNYRAHWRVLRWHSVVSFWLSTFLRTRTWSAWHSSLDHNLRKEWTIFGFFKHFIAEDYAVSHHVWGRVEMLTGDIKKLKWSFTLLRVCGRDAETFWFYVTQSLGSLFYLLELLRKRKKEKNRKQSTLLPQFPTQQQLYVIFPDGWEENSLRNVNWRMKMLLKKVQQKTLKNYKQTRVIDTHFTGEEKSAANFQEWKMHFRVFLKKFFFSHV